MKLQSGDVIRVRRSFYWHYGIYLNDECVIHYSCAPQHWWEVKARVKVATLEQFLGKRREYDVFYREETVREDIINKAKCRIGEEKYSLLYNNCRHFVVDCIADQR